VTCALELGRRQRDAPPNSDLKIKFQTSHARSATEAQRLFAALLVFI
jgi:hypothetical protein